MGFAIEGRSDAVHHGGDAHGGLDLLGGEARIAPAFHDAILACYHDAGLTPHIGQEAIQMQTIIALVSAGMGIALVPASLRHLARTGVRYVDLAEGAPSLETGIAWRREETAPTLARFLEIVSETPA